MTLRMTTRQWWRVIGTFAFLFLIFNASRPALGKLEGYFFPVVTDAVITKVVEGETYVDFSGSYTKIRDCDTVAYKWFLVSPDKLHKVQFDVFTFNPNWRSTSLGEIEFGPRRAYLSSWELMGYTEGTVLHECHPFYYTETTFFKGSELK